jgi:hypothetical protein
VVKPRIRIKTTFAPFGGMLNNSKKILLNLLNFFECGKIYQISEKYSRYQVENINQIKDKIIPHFKQYKLLSIKHKHFLKFNQVVQTFPIKGMFL